MGERRPGVIPPRQGRPPEGPSPRQVVRRRALALGFLVLVLGGLGWLAVAAIGGGDSSEQEVDRVVVGLPLTLRGGRGAQARETERFVEALTDVTNVPVVTFDERFTTDLAEQTPADAPEDARAAAHLLSGYLTWASSAPA